MFNHRYIFMGVSLAYARIIISKRDIKHIMEAIFNAPMASNAMAYFLPDLAVRR